MSTHIVRVKRCVYAGEYLLRPFSFLVNVYCEVDGRNFIAPVPITVPDDVIRRLCEDEITKKADLFVPPDELS